MADMQHFHDLLVIQRHADDHTYHGYAFDPPNIDWATEPGVDPVFRAAILWWHQHAGGSGFDDVYTIEEFLAHQAAAGLT